MACLSISFDSIRYSGGWVTPHESLILLVLSLTTTRSVHTAGATPPGQDLSLFYGDVTQLTTIPDRQRFLPKEIYSRMVLDAVVCCLDIVLVRINTKVQRKECLLVYRATEPVQGVWWWPGGRLLKGETFFAAAQRKAHQETGLSHVRPVQVLGVWNTFFPTSAWDTPTERGTQTVNPIVLVELLDPDASVQLDDTSEQYRWISLDPEEAKAAGEDPYVQQALLRLQAWDPNYIKL